MARLICRILSRPFSAVRLEDLLRLTDRQLFEIYCTDHDGDGDGGKPARPAGGAPPSGPPADADGYDPTYKDPDHPLFKWDIPRPREKAECKVDGRPIDGEAMLDNLLRGGLLKREDVERARAERRAAEAGKAPGGTSGEGGSHAAGRQTEPGADAGAGEGRQP